MRFPLCRSHVLDKISQSYCRYWIGILFYLDMHELQSNIGLDHKNSLKTDINLNILIIKNLTMNIDKNPNTIPFFNLEVSLVAPFHYSFSKRKGIDAPKKGAEEICDPSAVLVICKQIPNSVRSRAISQITQDRINSQTISSVGYVVEAENLLSTPMPGRILPL